MHLKHTSITKNFRMGHIVARYQGNYLPMFVVSERPDGSKHAGVVTDKNINPAPGSTLVALAIDVPALASTTRAQIVAS